MLVEIDEQRGGEQSRMVAIRMALHTMRLMEHWRVAFGNLDRAVIILAVTSITAEKLTRSGLPKGLEDLRREMPRQELGACNISSIAAATGFNRETARRKVNELVAEGLLVRSDDSSIAFSSTFSQQEWVLQLVERQLETIIRTTNELARDGVIRIAADI